MLNDKVYLWMMILACVAFAVAGTLCMVEYNELLDPNAASGPSPF